MKFLLVTDYLPRIVAKCFQIKLDIPALALSVTFWSDFPYTIEIIFEYCIRLLWYDPNITNL